MDRFFGVESHVMHYLTSASIVIKYYEIAYMKGGFTLYKMLVIAAAGRKDEITSGSVGMKAPCS